ncbi:hypothetical protein [Thiohalospira sp.]|uniref:hypothetical protein n=1 Tax=Thiohalospira sp. TaxID=3080549 RepID=UPI003980CCD4
MKTRYLAYLAPPLAISRAGVTGIACVGPVGLFWLGGIGTLIAGLATPHTWLAGLGVILWVLAAIWSRETVQAIREDRFELRRGCRDGDSTACRQVPPREDETDPLEQVQGDTGPEGR